MKTYTDDAKRFYKSAQWLRCRQGFIDDRRAKDGGLCQRCVRRYGDIVHHKIHIDALNINNPDVTLNWSNLEFLCIDCHNKEHFGDEERKVCFDESGQPVLSPLSAEK